MQRHCENGEKVAHFLRNHTKVSKVYCCGFEDHPGYKIAKQQMRGFGGMMSFTLKDDSIDTANQKRDEHLEGPDFFSAKQFQTIEELIFQPTYMTLLN